MLENKLWKISLGISFSFHAFMAGSFIYHADDIKMKASPSMDVVYYVQTTTSAKNPNIIDSKRADSKIDHIVREKDASPSLEIPVTGRKEFAAPAHLSSPIQKQPSPLLASAKPVSKIKTSLNKTEVSVPVLQSEVITNPKYFKYSDLIRDKIKQKAYHYIDHPQFADGEVSLTFSLSSSGILKQLRIVDGKTIANDYLRSVGLRSIKESSPFPSFPRDLPYPELSFNVVISFEKGVVK